MLTAFNHRFLCVWLRQFGKRGSIMICIHCGLPLDLLRNMMTVNPCPKCSKVMAGTYLLSEKKIWMDEAACNAKKPTRYKAGATLLPEQAMTGLMTERCDAVILTLHTVKRNLPVYFLYFTLSPICYMNRGRVKSVWENSLQLKVR